MYPLEKYKFYQNDNKVIAVSTYAGKSVRGVATCAENDTFDLEKGKKLAAARCNLKVAERRLKRAKEKYIEAADYMTEAEAYFNKIYDYLDDARDELNEASVIVAEIVDSL